MAYGTGYADGYADPTATMATRTLEVEFDAGVWTDIFADVVDVTTRRGRNRELGAFETGQLTVRVRNDTRKYDPDHAAGTYYGKLRPNRRVRFQAAYAGTTHPVFVGYVDRITQNYGGPNDATATFQVSDRSKILNRVQLPRSAYTAVVEGDDPALWYRLDESVDATTLQNNGTLGRDYDGVLTTDFSFAIPPAGGPEFGAESLVVRDDGTAAHMDETHWIHNSVPGFSAWSSGNSLAVEAWVRIDEAPTAGSLTYLFFQQGTGLNGTGIGFAILDDMRPRMVAYNDAGTPYAVRSTQTLSLGEKYHLVGRMDDDGTLHVFVNGVDDSTADLGVGGTASGTFTKGAGPVVAPKWYGFDIVLDELAVYTSTATEALTAAQIAAHNTAGRTPWAGDTPGARLARILALAGVAPADYDLDTGAPTLQATTLGGSVLGYAQKVEETTLGLFFVARDGTVTFVGRDESLTGAYLTSQATLVDADSGAGIGYRTVSADVDESTVITRATVSREGSVAVTYSDQAAEDEFEIIDETHDGLLHDNDDYSLDYAQWLVNTHKTPATRVGTLTLELAADPAAAFPAILGLELGERVTYKRKPQNVGSTFTQEMRVDSITHDTGGKYWRTSLQLSPFNLGEDAWPVFVWGTTEWGEHVWGL